MEPPASNFSTDDSIDTPNVHHNASAIIESRSLLDVYQVKASLLPLYCTTCASNIMLINTKEITPHTIDAVHSEEQTSLEVAKSAVLPNTTMEHSHTNASQATFCAYGESSPERGVPGNGLRSSKGSVFFSGSKGVAMEVAT
ncbi:hypothetical protein BWQ96_04409 [Gracilariopsis chorda]|uniref:Uncharacterized protein n=1 Tax=Gracilariopsis chorda TaxID=448386 RepID=A0A2V3IUS5_9FLOR|nr:hypothetical protein BWQ96_04409 [Gracilariopsis chorda]|eukprot:PXF45872.1 hypothetical protein BWQ96_04409 [Gracilariopsis chorda]